LIFEITPPLQPELMGFHSERYRSSSAMIRHLRSCLKYTPRITTTKCPERRE
jgi:hypothetical protein